MCEGKSFHIHAPVTLKVRRPTVESLTAKQTDYRWSRNEGLASPAMGNWGTCPLSTSNCLIFFWSLQSRTNSDIRVHVVR